MTSSEPARSEASTDDPLFLPPVEPDKPKKQKQRPLKAIVLWVLLLLMFVGVYSLFNRPSSKRHRSRQAHAETCSEGGTSWTGTLISGGVVGLFFFFVMVQMRGWRRFNVLREPALIDLYEGRFVLAQQRLEELVRKHRGKVNFVAAARHDLAQAQLRQGDLAAARETLTKLAKGVVLLVGSDIKVLAAAGLAEVYALQGQPDAAKKWLEEARSQLKKPLSNRVYDAAYVQRAAAMVHCRAGEHREALGQLERNWPVLESSLTARQLRDLQLLRAFARDQQVEGQYRSPAAGALAGLHGLPKLAFAHLTGSWPDLQAFVDAHELGT